MKKLISILMLCVTFITVIHSMEYELTEKNKADGELEIVVLGDTAPAQANPMIAQNAANLSQQNQAVVWTPDEVKWVRRAAAAACMAFFGGVLFAIPIYQLIPNECG